MKVEVYENSKTTNKTWQSPYLPHQQNLKSSMQISRQQFNIQL